MITATIAGRVGKDAEVRTTQDGTAVAGFSVAADSGWGEKKTTIWFDCSIWGNRGRNVAQYITKGTPITVIGELGQREHNGKTYLTIRVADFALQGGKRDDNRSDMQRQSDAAHAPPGGGHGGMDDDGGIPF